MKDRVSVLAYYEYNQRGSLRTSPASPCYFFCEIPKAWVVEHRQLHAHLFAACASCLAEVCAAANAREQFPETHQVSLRSVIITDLNFTELQARPWLYAAQPFHELGNGFPKYCRIDEDNGSLSGIDPDDFQRRAWEDILQIRASLLPAQKAEFLTRDIQGKCFLYYGDRLITPTGYSVTWSEDGAEGMTCTHLLYRLGERALIVSKEVSEYDDSSSETISLDYFCSDDDGVSWQAAPDFDASRLNGLRPVSEWP
jgi:hypothetical protein